jgi:beta-glucosidase
MSAPDADFLWGVATSSYQIEGYPLADGGGPCIWHEFAHTPGNTERGDTGDIACDHYHRYREDVALMRQLGVGGYRLSIRWPRVLPEGSGAPNEAGWSFYDRLLDELLQSGIQPFVTLYHWDLPVALGDRGGWLSPDMPAWFAEYAAQVMRRLGDRIGHVITLNEPWVTAGGGYLQGGAAPGMRNAFAAMRAAHSQILAHEAAYAAIKAERGASSVGITLSNDFHRPEHDTEADRAAAARANAVVSYPMFLDPLLRGAYPPEVRDQVERLLSAAPPLALAAAKRPPALDFVGMNYYFTAHVEAADDTLFGYRAVPHPEKPATRMGWTIDPDGMLQLLLGLHGRYGRLPVYITENGAAFDDRVETDGIHDRERIAYLEDHIASVLRARDAGVDVRGYFLWSLLDNFEWARGYDMRFGIVHVDRTTLDRTVKDSGWWYADVCRGARHPSLR